MSYPDVPGAGAMTAAMKKDVEGRLTGFLGEDIGGPPKPRWRGRVGGTRAERQLLVPRGLRRVLSVRLATVDRTSNADGLGTRAYWYDGAAEEYRPSPGLIADGSQDAFVAALKKRLEKREGVTPETVDAALGDEENRDAHLDDMAFTADGDLKGRLRPGHGRRPPGRPHLRHPPQSDRHPMTVRLRQPRPAANHRHELAHGGAFSRARVGSVVVSCHQLRPHRAPQLIGPWLSVSMSVRRRSSHAVAAEMDA
ncbi:hypothetical protein GCM10027074_29650 [Streptomyces deserti]